MNTEEKLRLIEALIALKEQSNLGATELTDLADELLLKLLKELK